MPLSDITNKTSKKREELDDFTRGMICALAVMANWKQVDICKKFNLSTSTVHSIVKKYKEDGLKAPKSRSGRPQALSNRDGRSLALSVRRAPTEPMGIHSQNLGSTRGVVSLPTIRKKLRQKGFSSFKVAQKPFLGLNHRRRRKNWVILRQNWTIEQWKKIIWSDESRFLLRHNDGGVRVIRKKGERLLDQHVLPTWKFGKGSVMVWGCFWAGGLGPLVTLKGKIDQEKYIDCLKTNFLPWLEKIKTEYGHNFIFQEDGASCHTGAKSRKWKQESGIKSFDYWPSQSPDLNPIEHIWRILGQRIDKRRAQITTLKQLEDALHEEWEKIALEECNNLVSSMPERCKAVKKANGGYTKY
jgi:transposase